jgi:hypothetical protein
VEWNETLEWREMVVWKKWKMSKKPLQDKAFYAVAMPFEAVVEQDAPDYRGVPTLMCPCGYNMFIVCATFDEDTRLPAFYLLDGRCASCGAWVTLPTEVDDHVSW